AQESHADDVVQCRIQSSEFRTVPENKLCPASLRNVCRWATMKVMPRTIIEPFRIKSVEPIRWTTRQERERLLQVDQHIVGGKQEEVVVCDLKKSLAFLAGGPADRLDAFDAKRLDDSSCDGAPRRNLVDLGCFLL